MDINQLSKQGFVTLEYDPETRQAVLEAMNSWIRFTRLPDEKKRLLSGGDRVNDFAYMRRQDRIGTADDKELFHAVRVNMEAIRTRVRPFHDPLAIEFIERTDHLIEVIYWTVVQFAKAIEMRYGLEHFAKRVAASSDNWTFRYLHYFPGSPLLAHPHVDRGGFTLHLYESEEGGQYLDSFSKMWLPWKVNSQETIIFPSMLLQHLSEGKIKALCHRVVPSPDPDSDGRYSLVVFIDFRHGHRYNDDPARGGKRLQEFEPGFNYTMPFSEFDKLFIPL